MLYHSTSLSLYAAAIRGHLSPARLARRQFNAKVTDDLAVVSAYLAPLLNDYIFL